MLLSSTRKDWLGDVRGDMLAGSVVAFALISEAIAFSIITGVAPQVCLYPAFCMPVILAVFGSRPAMISGATGALTRQMIALVKAHTLPYLLLAATVLTAPLQRLAADLQPGSLAACF